jgi:ABC-type proline/glycine betaine transport system substrate-binding protein
MLNKQTTEMLSLYDYLGHAAGKKLGEQVAAYAKLRKAKFGTKSVSNPAYQGHVMIYTKRFLDECFNAKKVFTPVQEDLTEINTQLAKDIFNSEFPF